MARTGGPTRTKGTRRTGATPSPGGGVTRPRVATQGGGSSPAQAKSTVPSAFTIVGFSPLQDALRASSAYAGGQGPLAPLVTLLGNDPNRRGKRKERVTTRFPDLLGMLANFSPLFNQSITSRRRGAGLSMPLGGL